MTPTPQPPGPPPAPVPAPPLDPPPPPAPAPAAPQAHPAAPPPPPGGPSASDHIATVAWGGTPGPGTVGPATAPTVLGAAPHGSAVGHSGTAPIAGMPVPQPVVAGGPAPALPGSGVDPFIGAVLQNYQITEFLGRGGMGSVYRARHTLLEREAAIKVLAPQWATNPQAAERFIREANTAASLKHPHVVEVYDVGRAGTAYYMAMELVDGVSVGGLLRDQGPLALPNAVAVTKAMALALGAAHDKGLIHRDVKPENILIPKGGGRPKLTDFGLARAVETADGDGLTAQGVVLGTPGYMAPEQCDDSGGGGVDARSDLYALGATLFAMLTGRPPFREASSLQTIVKQMSQPAPPLRSLAPEIPEPVAAVVDRLLEGDAGRRHQSAAELIKALDEAMRIPSGRLANLALADGGAASPQTVKTAPRKAPAAKTAPTGTLRLAGDPGTAPPGGTAVMGGGAKRKSGRRIKATSGRRRAAAAPVDEEPQQASPVAVALIVAGIAIPATLAFAMFAFRGGNTDPDPDPGTTVAAGVDADDDDDGDSRPRVPITGRRPVDEAGGDPGGGAAAADDDDDDSSDAGGGASAGGDTSSPAGGGGTTSDPRPGFPPLPPGLPGLPPRPQGLPPELAWPPPPPLVAAHALVVEKLTQIEDTVRRSAARAIIRRYRERIERWELSGPPEELTRLGDRSLATSARDILEGLRRAVDDWFRDAGLSPPSEEQPVAGGPGPAPDADLRERLLEALSTALAEHPVGDPELERTIASYHGHTERESRIAPPPPEVYWWARDLLDGPSVERLRAALEDAYEVAGAPLPRDRGRERLDGPGEREEHATGPGGFPVDDAGWPRFTPQPEPDRPRGPPDSAYFFDALSRAVGGADYPLARRIQEHFLGFTRGEASPEGGPGESRPGPGESRPGPGESRPGPRERRPGPGERRPGPGERRPGPVEPPGQGGGGRGGGGGPPKDPEAQAFAEKLTAFDEVLDRALRRLQGHEHDHDRIDLWLRQSHHWVRGEVLRVDRGGGDVETARIEMRDIYGRVEMLELWQLSDACLDRLAYEDKAKGGPAFYFALLTHRGGRAVELQPSKRTLNRQPLLGIFKSVVEGRKDDEEDATDVLKKLGRARDRDAELAVLDELAEPRLLATDAVYAVRLHLELRRAWLEEPLDARVGDTLAHLTRGKGQRKGGRTEITWTDGAALLEDWAVWSDDEGDERHELDGATLRLEGGCVLELPVPANGDAGVRIAFEIEIEERDEPFLVGVGVSDLDDPEHAVGIELSDGWDDDEERAFHAVAVRSVEGGGEPDDLGGLELDPAPVRRIELLITRGELVVKVGDEKDSVRLDRPVPSPWHVVVQVHQGRFRMKALTVELAPSDEWERDHIDRELPDPSTKPRPGR